jgi:hypothetical protein
VSAEDVGMSGQGVSAAAVNLPWPGELAALIAAVLLPGRSSNLPPGE